jgi:hypothetical protein
MPFYTDDKIGPENYGLQDFKPTYGQSLSATVDDAVTGLPSVIGYNVYANRQRNKQTSDRLSAYDAETMIKESGVHGINAKDGEYNHEALSAIIERQRKAQITSDVLSRTEYSWTGTPVRGLAALATNIIDPVNVASAFIPVVGEARGSAMLAKSAVGSFGRAVTRAGIGAAEGAVGAAMVEPLIYAGRTELQDDYHMSDSLLNIAFGGALGGGLHVTAGHIADTFRARDPYTRFSGLDTQQVKTVMDFEHSLTPDMPATAIDSSIADWTPKMREAAGFGKRVESAAVIPEAAAKETVDIPRSMNKEDFQSLAKQYPKEVMDSIISRVAARDMPEIPFKKLVDTTQEGARKIAVRELTDSMNAELLGTAGNKLAPKEVSALNAQLKTVTDSAKQVDAQFKEVAKELQGTGLSRKQAESKAKEVIADRKAELETQQSALAKKIANHVEASRAEQGIAELKKGNVPATFEPLVQNRVSQIQAHVDTLRTLDHSAASVIDAATPEARQAAFRSALAQAVNGRMPDVESIVRGDYTFQSIKSIADRQEKAESLAVGDPAASKSAKERLDASAKETGLPEAEAELLKVDDMLKELQKNLEQNGMDQAITAKMMEQMKPFDEAIAKAENYRAAAKAAAICGLRS